VPRDGQHIDLPLQRFVERRAGRELAGCVFPQAHVQPELELAARIGDERAGIGGQIHDAPARRDARP
jgi:hypothetical protein